MNKNPPKKLKIYQSPMRLLLLIAVTIFFVHTFGMVLFAVHPHFTLWLGSVVQSSLLLVLLFPVLYFFSFRPLLLHIAEREEAEEAMRESEHKYRNLFEHLSDAAFLVDVETGRILDTNSQGERLLGRTRGEIMGMNQSKLYPPEQEQEQRKRFAAYARQERPGDYETEIARKDGACVPVRLSGGQKGGEGVNRNETDIDTGRSVGCGWFEWMRNVKAGGDGECAPGTGPRVLLPAECGSLTTGNGEHE